jgi:O-antigen biosynthesis protein
MPAALAGECEEIVPAEPWPEDRPLVSVVVVCFNYGKFVAEAVDSVLAQTFGDFEIVVVDGGSTDPATRQTVAALRRPKTRTLFRAEPCRTGDNRNFGIAATRGKYICCLDADDKLEPTYIEKAAFLLESRGNDVVSTAYRKFGLSNEAIGFIPSPRLDELVEANHVATCALFRRELWERAGGFRDAPPGRPYIYEDWRFWVSLAALGARFANITGEQLFLYRAHGSGSISSNPRVLPYEEQRRMILEAEAALLTADAFEKSRARARLACARPIR